MLKGIAYHQDSWVQSDKLYVHISDLSIHRAYAVFDYMKEKKGKVPWIDAYLDRFFRSLNLAGIGITQTKQEVHDLIHDMIRQNGFGISGIKLLATGGYSPNGFTVPDQSNFFILNYKGKQIDPVIYQNGIVLIHDDFQRPNPEIKTTQYFNTAQLYQKMLKHKADDVLYHHHGIITETSRANFYVIKNGGIRTSGGHILSGITRKNFLKTFKDKYPIDLGDLYFSDLKNIDEAFITSTTRGVVPVVKIEDLLIGNGEVGSITKKLMAQFNDKY
ncbi:MAG: hypothetical protein HKP31_07860 [Nitrosopumilus sp.]|nr:hypothetical protein [Nitrosopumilus sp.]